jgi:hypothetical protein
MRWFKFVKEKQHSNKENVKHMKTTWLIWKSLKKYFGLKIYFCLFFSLSSFEKRERLIEKKIKKKESCRFTIFQPPIKIIFVLTGFSFLEEFKKDVSLKIFQEKKHWCLFVIWLNFFFFLSNFGVFWGWYVVFRGLYCVLEVFSKNKRC